MNRNDFIRRSGILFLALHFISVFCFAQLTVVPGSQIILPPDYLGVNGANTIRSPQGWYDSVLVKGSRQINAATVRYPAGTISGYWDWHKGGFVSDEMIPAGMSLPGKFMNTELGAHGLKDFKTVVDSIGCTPIHDINVLTSSIWDQKGMLFTAKAKGIPVRYVEFGNEFYLDYENYLSIFPTAESYRDSVNKWVLILKKQLPGIKIAAVGAQFNNKDFIRKKTWNSLLFNGIGGIDAATIHLYPNSGITYKTTSENLSLDLLPEILSRPFRIRKELSSGEIDSISSYKPGIEIWITEYNLFEKSVIMHGSWAHGLFLSGITLACLEDQRITKLIIHTLTGNGVYGLNFEDENGFEYDIFKPPLLKRKTKPGEFTAIGNSMSLITKAMQRAVSAQRLYFSGSNIPFFTKKNVNDTLIYGWLFKTPFDSQAVVLNNSGTQLLIKGNFFPGGGFYEQVDGDPLDFIIGNAKMSAFTDSTLRIQTGTFQSSSNIILKPYSITRLYTSPHQVIARPTMDTVCSGVTTSIIASGGLSYSWFPSNGLTSTTGSVVGFNATTPGTYNYTVTATLLNGSTSSAVVKVVVVSKPTITVTADQTICPGVSVCLSASLTNSTSKDVFTWFPVQGMSSPDSAVTCVAPKQSTDFIVYASNGKCWNITDTVRIIVKPHADAGPDEFACNGSVYVLGTSSDTSLFTYKWKKNGTQFSNLPNPAATINDTAVFRLIVTDKLTLCKDSDEVKIIPVQCCEAPNSQLTFPPYTLVSEIIPVLKNVLENDHRLGDTITGNSLEGFNDTIVFNGPLILDRSFSFIDCPYLHFSEQGRIIIRGTTDLTISNSRLRSCSNSILWSGIYCDNPAAIITVSNQSHISRADTAFYLSRGVTLNMDNTTLDKNSVGIRFEDYDDPAGGHITNSVFKCSGNTINSLNPGHTLKHIDIFDVTSIKIGDENLGTNEFSNADFALYVRKASLTAYNNSFTGIRTKTGYSGLTAALYAGNNINDKTRNIVVGGDSSININHFSDCFEGIRADTNLNISITGNGFDNVDFPVLANYGLYTSVDVNYNIIRNAKKGIQLNELYQASRINIKNNYLRSYSFNYTSFDGMAIGVSNYSSPANAKLVIENNDIDSCRIGVWVSNISNAVIKNNSIKFSQDSVGISSYKHYGIWLANSPSDTLLGNIIERTVSLPGSLSNYRKNFMGGYIQNSVNVLLKENETGNAGTCFWFYGDCSGTKLKCNNMISGARGVYIESGSIDNQGSLTQPWDNRWINWNNSYKRVNGKNITVEPEWYIRGLALNSNEFSTSPYNPAVIDEFPNITGSSPCDTSVERVMGIVETESENDFSATSFSMPSNPLLDLKENKLTNIARQNPLHRGEEVYFARAILKKEINDSDDDDEMISELPLISVSPNPASERLTVSLASGTIKSVSVFDLSGRLVFHTMTATDSEVDVSHFHPGQYMIKATDENGTAAYASLSIIR